MNYCVNAINKGFSIGAQVNCSVFHRLKSTQSSSEYCLQSIRQHDYENFICTLLLKNQARSVAIAIRSLNVELAKVAEQVSQESIGLMRLKFWDEVIDKCYTKDFKQIAKHPVAMELFKAISKVKLSKRFLKNLVTSRQQTISAHSFKSLDEAEKYAEQTVSSTYYLILEGSGISNMDADHAASHLGKAQGLVQQLRSVPCSKKINFVPIPEELLIKYQVSQEDVLRGKNSEKLSNCVYDMASLAHQHLQKARNLSDKVPEDCKRTLLPAVPVSMYLDKLQQEDYNALAPSLAKRSWSVLPKLYFFMLRNKY